MEFTLHNKKALKDISHSCSECSLVPLCLPVGMSQEDMARLEAIVETRKPYQNGEAIFTAGSPFRAVYAVKSGLFKTVSVDEGGAENVVGFHLPGELVGLDAIYLEKYSSSAVSIGTSSVCVMRYEELTELADRVIREIEQAKQALREPGIGADTERMRWALHTIQDAGLLLTAGSGGNWELGDSDFKVPGALASFEHLEMACADTNLNPFIEYFENYALVRLRQDPPKAVGLSLTYLCQLIPALTLVHLIREHFPQMPIIVGGAYLTATCHELARLPTTTLPADAIVLHDGEQALDAWLNSVLGQGAEAKAPNLYVRDGKGFRRTSFDQVQQVQLEDLPVPMWTSDGINLDQYLVPKYPIALPLSRGCYWGRCAFCNISNQTSSVYRRRSVGKAVEDIKYAMEQTGSNWFDFPVDSFKPRDLQELAEAILAEGLEIEWGAEVLLDPGFKDELLGVLARSGCRCLRFGLESASPQTLKQMNKSAKPDIARRILGSCHAKGIKTAVMLIVGFPTEMRGALEETYDFVVDNRDRIDFLTFHGYSLVHGSPMAKDPGAFGLYLKPSSSVFAPNLPFVNTNPGGMQEEHITELIDPMRESLREYYPDLGELWTTGIGGWMTFAGCCESREREAVGRL